LIQQEINSLGFIPSPLSKLYPDIKTNCTTLLKSIINYYTGVTAYNYGD